MKKLAKFLGYVQPVLVISYVIGFNYYYVEWLTYVDATQDKWQMVAAIPVFFLGIVFLFPFHFYYGKFVKWIAK